MSRMIWIRLGAVFMFLGVALGAFGAHGLKDVFERHGSLEWWRTAVLYHLIHALGLFAVGWLSQGLPSSKWTWAGMALVGGICLFSGSLYLMSVTGLRWLGAITPLGGLLFLTAWVLVFLGASK